MANNRHPSAKLVQIRPIFDIHALIETVFIKEITRNNKLIKEHGLEKTHSLIPHTHE